MKSCHSYALSAPRPNSAPSRASFGKQTGQAAAAMIPPKLPIFSRWVFIFQFSQDHASPQRRMVLRGMTGNRMFAPAQRKVTRAPSSLHAQYGRQRGQRVDFPVRALRNAFRGLAETVTPHDVESESLGCVGVPCVGGQEANMFRRNAKFVHRQSINRWMRF